MSKIDLPPDLAELVRAEMSRGAYTSEVALLRDALRAFVERREDLDAVRTGIAEMEAGQIRPFKDALESIRKDHGL